MKHKLVFTLAFTVIAFIYACDEKYEPRVHQDYTPIESAFFAGDKDSCTYYDYEPDIEISINYLNNGYFGYSQNFDLDNDGINDFALGVEGFKDNSIPTSNYWRTIYLETLYGYETSYENEDNFGGVGSVVYGDTLTNYWFESSDDNRFQMIESGFNYEANSYDTCCGNWNKWGKERYVAFQKIDGDTILGWMRLEMRADTDLIVLKDCAIQKFSTKRN